MKKILALKIANGLNTAREQNLSFAEFEKLYQTDAQNIKRTWYVMPRIGSDSLGKMHVIYKKPVLNSDKGRLQKQQDFLFPASWV